MTQINLQRKRAFKLVYKEACAIKTEDRKRENFLKPGFSKKFLDKILK